MPYHARGEERSDGRVHADLSCATRSAATGGVRAYCCPVPWLYPALLCSTLACSTLLYPALPCSALLCPALSCSVLLCSATFGPTSNTLPLAFNAR